jgi:hypothetical protein
MQVSYTLLPPEERPQPRILGIDIENKPLWYGGGDFVYDRDVCYSWKWMGESVDTVWLDWRQDDETLLHLLAPLRAAIEDADYLLGHNFQHDWKGLRATFNHLKQPFLPDRPYVDTMRCLPGGMPRSLEWLCAHLGIGEKPHVTAHTWVAAIDRNDPSAIAIIKERNRADVVLTERLYEKELDLGWITAPRVTRDRKGRSYE